MLGIYCRISREKEAGKDRSIQDQELSGIELAKRLNLEFKVYKDEGKSGTLPIEKRPELNNLIDDIYKREITAIYIYDQSRLERSPQVRFVLNEIFKKYEVDVYTESGLVQENIESELIGNVVSVFNHYYTKQTSRRIKGVQKRLIEQGKALAINPFGYTTDEKGYLVVDESNREQVKEIFALSLKGVGTQSIADHLNELGVKKNHYNGTKKAKEKTHKWVGNNVLDIIKNPIYKGKRKRNDKYYDVEPIISAKYWQKVNDNLQNNKVNRGKKVQYNYLLKGIAKCGRCGNNYVGHVNTANRTYCYSCSSKTRRDLNYRCKNRSINIDVLDSIVWSQVQSGILLDKVLKHFKTKSKSKELKTLEKKIHIAKRNIETASNKRQRLFKEWAETEDKDLKKVILEYREQQELNERKLEQFEYELGLYKSENNENDFVNYLRTINAFDRYISGNSTKLPPLKNITIKDLKMMRKAFSSKDKEILKRVTDVKKEMIRNVVSKAVVYYDDLERRFFVEIFFNVPSLESTIVMTDWKYKSRFDLTYKPSTLKLTESLTNIKNVLRDKYLKEFESVKLPL